MATCSSARAAVSVRRGSMTTTRPPRVRIALMRPLTFGAVMRLPFDTAGLPPTQRNRSVRSMSGGHQQPLMAEHVERRHHVGKLVERAGRVEVVGAKPPEQKLPGGEQAEVVGRRIALVHGDGVAAVPAANLPETAGREVERLLPGHLPPAVGGAHHRVAQAVRVLVDIRQRPRLWAQETVAVWIVLVATDVGDAPVVDGHDDPATGLAERAGVQMRARRRHVTILLQSVRLVPAHHSRGSPRARWMEAVCWLLAAQEAS